MATSTPVLHNQERDHLPSECLLGWDHLDGTEADGNGLRESPEQTVAIVLDGNRARATTLTASPQTPVWGKEIPMGPSESEGCAATADSPRDDSTAAAAAIAPTVNDQHDELFLMNHSRLEETRPHAVDGLIDGHITDESPQGHLREASFGWGDGETEQQDELRSPSSRLNAQEAWADKTRRATTALASQTVPKERHLSRAVSYAEFVDYECF